MVDDKTLQLINLSTGEVIARLNDAQVQDLRKYVEQESTSDTSFHITSETVESLRAVADLLATALGDAQEVRVGYAPIPDGSARVRGRLLALESNSPLVGLKIETYDEDIAFDDCLGWCYSDLLGRFEFRFDEAAFKDAATLNIEGQPELKVRILNPEGAELGWVGVLREKDADFGDIFVAASGKVIAPVLYPGAAAICPNCGSLYRAGFTTCSDDQTPLRPSRASKVNPTGERP
jgi:hypothetical protein